jgi:hypothetical protein
MGRARDLVRLVRAMSRYYFHIRDGLRFVPDEEGMECHNLFAVQSEARASARDLTEAALKEYSRGFQARSRLKMRKEMRLA